jgi:hypothetical protein
MKQSYHFLMILFISCFTTKLYSQSVPSYVPTNGLVGWWGFNGNAQDGSGNGNHGTVIFSWQLKLDEVLYFSTVCFLGVLTL